MAGFIHCFGKFHALKHCFNLICIFRIRKIGIAFKLIFIFLSGSNFFGKFSNFCGNLFFRKIFCVVFAHFTSPPAISCFNTICNISLRHKKQFKK